MSEVQIDKEFFRDEAKSDLPLFGQICCRLAAQPNAHLSDSVAGSVFTQVREWTTKCAHICTRIM